LAIALPFSLQGSSYFSSSCWVCFSSMKNLSQWKKKTWFLPNRFSKTWNIHTSSSVCSSQRWSSKHPTIPLVQSSVCTFANCCMDMGMLRWSAESLLRYLGLPLW
jgi:Major Facilitator Superfamily